MTSVAPAAERIYLGMDVSRDKIAVAVLVSGRGRMSRQWS